MYDGKGRQVAFGKELGKGGEGFVREVAGDPRIVAKIYHKPRTLPQIEKLRLLPVLINPQLASVAAWPIETLSDSPGGTPRGILLPRVTGKEIHFVYSPGQRRQYFPNYDWSSLVHIGMNAAAAVQSVHETGVVIGDLNQGGFFVAGDGKVCLIDCDSFQLKYNGKTYRCVVRVPHFTPPELQSCDLAATDAVTSHDSFALGVLLFHLLFMGRHPFAGRHSGAGDMPIERAIAERRFAFGRRRFSYQMDVPPNSPTLELVTSGVAELFERAFCGTQHDRPTALEWHAGMHFLKKSLQRCKAEASHIFPGHLNRCPWCTLEHGGGPTFFSVTRVSFDFDAGFDIDAVWREVKRIAASTFPDQLQIPPFSAVPRDIPRGARFRSLGAEELIPELPPLELIRLPEVPAEPPISTPEMQAAAAGLEQEPEFPMFEPAILPPERTLELLPVPSPPVVTRPDRFKPARDTMRRETRRWEYRLSKLAALAGFAIVCAGIIRPTLHKVATVIVGALLCGSFGVAVVYWWIQIRRQYRIDAKVAKKASDADEQNVRSLLQTFVSRKAEIEESNRLRKLSFEEWKTGVEKLREELPRINSERYKAWQLKRAQIERERDAIRERNAIRIREHREQLRMIDAQNRQRWQDAVAETLHQRTLVEEENGRRRAAWNDLLPQHQSRVQAILRINEMRRQSREQFELEFRTRSEALSGAQIRLDEICREWQTSVVRFREEVGGILARVTTAHQAYLALKSAFEKERDQLMSSARQTQMNDFLMQQLVVDATISGIGQKRKDILLGFGIESAYHISPHGLSVVKGQGFGEKSMRALHAWRGSCERRFVFDPSKQVSSPSLARLHIKSESRRNSLKSMLNVDLGKLKRLHLDQLSSEQAQFAKAERASSSVAQAQADLHLAHQYRGIAVQ